MYSKADSCCRAVNKINHAALMLKAKAKAYTLLGDFALAEIALNEALSIFTNANNKKQISIITSGLATLALDSKQITIDSLKKFLTNSYIQYSAGNIPPHDHNLWAYIYLQEGKIDSAHYYNKLTANYGRVSANWKCGIYSLTAQIEEKTGNYQSAARYWNQSYTLFDSISRMEKHQLIQQVEKRYQNQQLQHQNEMLRIHTRLIFSIGTLVFTIVVFSLALILKHRRETIRRKTEEIARYRSFIEELQEEYTELKEQYDRVKPDSKEEQKLLMAMDNRLSDLHRMLSLAYSGGCKPQEFYKAFKEMAVSMNRESGAFSDLQFLVNKRKYGAIDYLRKHHPSLTGSELDMLSMLLFGFTFDGIRLIYNHDNTDSLYSRRTHIREKLQLPPRYRLEKFLQELVQQLKKGIEPTFPPQAPL